MCSLGVFSMQKLLVFFWILTTTLFFTITTAAFGATPIGDVEAGLCEEEDNIADSDIETAHLIPRIVFAAHSSTNTLSFTSSVAPLHSFTSRLTAHTRMISTTDSVASNLWRTHLEYGAFVPHPALEKALPTIPHSGSSAPQDPVRGDNNSDASELPYLTKDYEEPPTDYPMLPSPGISSSVSGFSSSFLANMLYDSDSDDETHANTSVESMDSEVVVSCPIPRSSSRPVLHVRVEFASPTYVEPSSPSPVDSGYASRPDTPFLEKDVAPACTENTVVSVGNVLIEKDASPADLKLVHHAVRAKEIATQGPTLPQIVLFDEQGRVVDHALDDQLSSGSVTLDAYDDESAYGGIIPVSEVDEIPMGSALSVTPWAPVLLAQSRAPVTTLPTTSVYYHHCHTALTFILESVEEEEEEWDAEQEESNAGVEEPEVLLTRTHRAEGAIDTDVKPLTISTVEERVSIHSQTVPHVVQISDNILDTVTSTTASLLSAATKPLYSEEDDELEACGLFFTAPDAHYFRLTRPICQPAGKPEIMFGLLSTLPSQAPVKALNTAYHAAAEDPTRLPLVAKCTFACENGYWMKEGGLATIDIPRECPMHGGRGSCRVGDIFYCVAYASTCDSPSLDYVKHAAEVVGTLVIPSFSSFDDFDEDELVLHRAEVVHAPQRRHTVPDTGADYDEFMSGFMDDVDLRSSSSTDSLKAAPLGKLGDALKELRNAAMPDAVDHLKEGLEKTESVFRAAFAASPFNLSLMSDKLHFKSGHKPSVSKEKNELYNVMKERSAVSIKGKWSNMLNKFTR